MHPYARGLTGILAAALLVSGCYGPFNLTRKLHQWNGEVSENKWAVEIVFLALVWAPVYGLAGLGDGLIFNTIEFWGGENPITMEEEPKTRSRRSPQHP